VRLQVVPPAVSRQTGEPGSLDIALFGPGMANARTITRALDSNGTSVTVMFEGIPEGKKWATAYVWDDTDISHLNPLGIGFTGFEVAPQQTTSAALQVTVPVLPAATTVVDKHTVNGAELSILDEAGAANLGPADAFLLSQAADGVLFHGWLVELSVPTTTRQAATTGGDLTIAYLLDDPIVVLPEGAGVGYRRESRSGVRAYLEDPATQDPLPPVSGYVEGLVEYHDVHGVSVPAGNYPNASVVGFWLRGVSDPEAEIPFWVDTQRVSYYVQGQGPVLTRQFDHGAVRARSGAPLESLRALVRSGPALTASPTRSPTIPYPLGIALHPLTLGHAWEWRVVALNASPPATAN